MRRLVFCRISAICTARVLIKMDSLLKLRRSIKSMIYIRRVIKQYIYKKQLLYSHLRLI